MMANYFMTLITFESTHPGVLEDLYNHILTAAQISKSFNFTPPFESEYWTKYYTVAMTYGVQTIYDIGRCTILNVSDIIKGGFRFGLVSPPNQFTIHVKTAYTPMLVFWNDIIDKFYSNQIEMHWRSYAEENYTMTDQESNPTLYSITALSEGDNVFELDKLFDKSKAPFYTVKDPRVDVYRTSDGLARFAFEDWSNDLTEAHCVEYLHSLSSKYNDLQYLWQVLTDPKYTFPGDINITQDSVMPTEEIVEEDIEQWASVQDPETLEGLDYEDMMYKTYDDPNLFVEQQPIKPEPCDQQQFPDCTDGNIMN